MSTPDRITTRSIIEELLQLANLEKGLGYTIKMLAIAPGKAIRMYLFAKSTGAYFLAQAVTTVLFLLAGLVLYIWLSL